MYHILAAVRAIQRFGLLHGVSSLLAQDTELFDGDDHLMLSLRFEHTVLAVVEVDGHLDVRRPLLAFATIRELHLD